MWCIMCIDSSIIGINWSIIWSIYKYSTAHTPNKIVSRRPPILKIRIGASPPSRVVPTRSPTFFAYRRRGPEHCGHLKPALCSSKYNPAHSNWNINESIQIIFHSKTHLKNTVIVEIWSRSKAVLWVIWNFDHHLQQFQINYESPKRKLCSNGNTSCQTVLDSIHQIPSLRDTHPLINITAIFAHPFSFPVQCCFFSFSFLLCLRFLRSKNVQTCAGCRCRCGGYWCRWGNCRRTNDEGGCCRKRQTNQSQEKGDEGGIGFHVNCRRSNSEIMRSRRWICSTTNSD